MKTTVITIALLFVAAFASAADCHTSLPSGTLVDDFTSGQFGLATKLENTYVPSNVGPSGVVPATKAGDPLRLAGGVRSMLLRTTGNPFHQPAEVDVVNNPTGGGALVLTSGAREFIRLEYYYGFNLTGAQFVPLGLYPTADCDRIRFTFDSNARGLNFNVEFLAPRNGVHNAMRFISGVNIDQGPSTNPFCVDFPFSRFSGVLVSDGSPVSPDFSSSGIDFIMMIMQSGSNIGADNFAVKKIEFVNGATAGQCTYSS